MVVTTSIHPLPNYYTNSYRCYENFTIRTEGATFENILSKIKLKNEILFKAP